jgi:hypothetical protein
LNEPLLPETFSSGLQRKFLHGSAASASVSEGPGPQTLCSDLFTNGERVVIKSCQRKGNAMSDNDMKAELERLRSENAALKKGASDGIRMKVSEKGAVSVYGMGRFPVTLYKEQWLKLLNMSEEIRAFIAENEARLKAKE